MTRKEAIQSSPIPVHIVHHLVDFRVVSGSETMKERLCQMAAHLIRNGDENGKKQYCQQKRAQAIIL